MKNKLTLIVGIALIGLISGCASLKPLTPNEQATITAAADLGTTYDLSTRPQDLSYFVAAAQELYSVADSTNAVTASSIEEALKTSGQTNVVVDTAIITVVQLANGYIASNSSTNAYAVNQVCGYVADGITMATQNKLTALKLTVRK